MPSLAAICISPGQKKVLFDFLPCHSVKMLPLLQNSSLPLVCKIDPVHVVNTRRQIFVRKKDTRQSGEKSGGFPF
jgi:hypothetical protein